MLDAPAPSSLVDVGVDNVAATGERPRGSGVTIESEPHDVVTDGQGLLGHPGVETMAVARDSDDNLVSLVAVRPLDESS